MFGDYQQFVNVAGFSSMPAGFLTLLLVLSIWSLIWKGVALWKAARNTDKVWYVILLIVNTVGILEIIYIFFFSKKKGEQAQNNLQM